MFACGGPPAGRDAAPNVLLVTLDTTRADRLGAYGARDARTPALDDLARRGTVFEQAFTSAPMTLPAHATLFTGLEPPEHALRVNGQGRLDAAIPTMASRLRQRGYRTAAFVAAFVLDERFGLASGFDVYDADLRNAAKQDVPEPLSVSRPGDRVVDAALAWLAHRRHPFFCWVHLYDPHHPHMVHPELEGTRFAGDASYEADVAFADIQVGRLLAFLDAARLTDETLIVIVGDHGEGLGDHGELEHGYLLTPEVLRVPLVVALPGIARANHRVDVVVSLVDVLPTVLDLAGVAHDYGLPGRSLRPALAGEPMLGHPSYAETDLPYTSYRWSPMRSVTTRRWKYVRSARPELYDRTRDAGERRNLAAARPGKLARLERLLTARERALQPRSAVPVVLDPGARQRLGALGYVITAGSLPVSGPRDSLKDVKDMLPLKQLEGRMKDRLARGTLGRREMVDVMRTLVRESPASPSFQHNLGLALVAEGAIDQGIAHLTEAVRLEPGFGEAHLSLGNGLASRGRLDAAAAHYEAALAARPGLAEAQVGIGNVRAAAGDFEAAIRAYEEALRADPTQPTPHVNLGNALERRGRVVEAIAHYESALALSPGLATVRYRLGLLRADRGDRNAAVRQWKAAVRAAPRFAAAHGRLAEVRAQRGDLAGAIRHQRAAVEAEPGDVRLATQLAWWLATSEEPRLRDGGRAVALAEQASRATEGNEALVLDVLAAAYAEQRRIGAAVETARRALVLAERGCDQELAAGVRDRLALYERGCPYRRPHAPSANGPAPRGRRSPSHCLSIGPQSPSVPRPSLRHPSW